MDSGLPLALGMQNRKNQASGLPRQATVSGNHTGESRFGLADRKVSREVASAKLGVSTCN